MRLIVQALPLETTATIAVEIDDAGHNFRGPNEGLVIATLKF